MSSPAPSYAHTLVIGKLYPPHAGHLHLIHTALAHTRAAPKGHLTLILCHRPTEHPSGPVRHAWLSALLALHVAAGHVRLMLVEDTYDQDDSELWAKLTLNWLNVLDPDGDRPLEAVFTSEAYGDPYTRFLTQFSNRTVVHHCVDRPRAAFPVSGTLVRIRPLSPALWSPAGLIPAPVRAFYIPRVVLVGAESTGKSTLAARLAQVFCTAWVAEVGRQVTETKLAAAGIPLRADMDAGAPTADWASKDFVDIARAQVDAEDQAAMHLARAHQAGSDHPPLLVCDTDALATVIWHERYMLLPGATSPPAAAATSPADAVQALNMLLTCTNAQRHTTVYLIPDVAHVPFVQDGTRDGEHVREWMHTRFLGELRARGCEYYVLDAPGYAGREEQAVRVVRRVVERLGFGGE